MLKRLEGWHRRIAKIGGVISMIIVRRRINRDVLHEWATELEAIAKEMRSDLSRD